MVTLVIMNLRLFGSCLFLVVVTTFNSLGALRAGIAVRVVTPDPLLPVSGGVGLSKPTNRKEGELTVRALVLEQESTRVAIVSRVHPNKFVVFLESSTEAS